MAEKGDAIEKVAQGPDHVDAHFGEKIDDCRTARQGGGLEGAVMGFFKQDRVFGARTRKAGLAAGRADAAAGPVDEPGAGGVHRHHVGKIKDDRRMLCGGGQQGVGLTLDAARADDPGATQPQPQAISRGLGCECGFDARAFDSHAFAGHAFARAPDQRIARPVPS